MRVAAGSTDQSVVIRIVDSTDGTPEEGVTSGSGGLALWYCRMGGTVTALTESDLAAVDSAHSDGGMKHMDDGYYRVDIPDAAFATGAPRVTIGGTVTGMVVLGTIVEIGPEVANAVQIDGSAPAAVNLGAAANTMVLGTVNTTITPTITQFTTNLVNAVNDHYKGRIVIFRTGTLAEQAREITAYLGSNKRITVATMTSAPANGDTFEIV